MTKNNNFKGRTECFWVAILVSWINFFIWEETTESQITGKNYLNEWKLLITRTKKTGCVNVRCWGQEDRSGQTRYRCKGSLWGKFSRLWTSTILIEFFRMILNWDLLLKKSKGEEASVISISWNSTSVLWRCLMIDQTYSRDEITSFRYS